MAAPRFFCTLFDSGYLIKGVAMLQSLRRHCPEAVVFVLCMDEQAQRILQALPLGHVRCIPLADIETPELLAAKADRGIGEYCWTLEACLPWYVLRQFAEVDAVHYVDADLFFFSSLQPLFDEIGDAPIAIIEHRFTDRLKVQEVNGRFCVEWVTFRREAEGLACLDRWRGQCIEWCYYRLEDGKMADQKYLDEWPQRYPGCHIIQLAAAGVAPWNFPRYRFGQAADGTPTVDGQPLVFYHFHQFQLLANGSIDRLSEAYTQDAREPDAVYRIYEQAMAGTIVQVRSVVPGFSAGFKSPLRVAGRRFGQRYLPRGLRRFFHRVFGY
jgi:hypothetical protein